MRFPSGSRSRMLGAGSGRLCSGSALGFVIWVFMGKTTLSLGASVSSTINWGSFPVGSCHGKQVQ